MRIPITVYEKLDQYWLRDLQKMGVIDDNFQGDYEVTNIGGQLYLVSVVNKEDE